MLEFHDKPFALGAARGQEVLPEALPALEQLLARSALHRIIEPQTTPSHTPRSPKQGPTKACLDLVLDGGVYGWWYVGIHDRSSLEGDTRGGKLADLEIGTRTVLYLKTKHTSSKYRGSF